MKPSWSYLQLPNNVLMDDVRKLAPEDCPPPAAPAFVISTDTFRLKKFVHVKALSKISPCFTAEVWLRGQHLGTVHGDGNGGVIIPNGVDRLEAFLRTIPFRSRYSYAYDCMRFCQRSDTDSMLDGGWRTETTEWDADTFLIGYAEFLIRMKQHRSKVVVSNTKTVTIPSIYSPPASAKSLKPVGTRWGIHYVAYCMADRGFFYYPEMHPLALSGWIRHIPTGITGRLLSLRQKTATMYVPGVREQIDGKLEDFEPVQR